MNIQKFKFLAIIFFLLTMFGIISSTVLFYKLEKRTKELNEKKEELEDLNKQLEDQDKKLSEALRKRQTPDDPVDSNQDANSKSVEEIKNSVFKFGLYAVDLTNEKSIVSKYLRDRNFTIVAEQDYDKPPPWFSQEGPTIFYYSKTNLELAKKVKSDLDQKIGLDFHIARGAGLGVKESERAIKLKIHLVESKKKVEIDNFKIGIYYLAGDKAQENNAQNIKRKLLDNSIGRDVQLYPESKEFFIKANPPTSNEIRYEPKYEETASKQLLESLQKHFPQFKFVRRSVGSRTANFISIFVK